MILMGKKPLQRQADLWWQLAALQKIRQIHT
jgi:hypothetical protein